MKSVISVAAGTLLGAIVAMPSAYAQTDGLPDDSPGSGAIIQPHREADGDLRDDLFREEPGVDDDAFEDDLDSRGDEAGDAPLTHDFMNDDPSKFPKEDDTFDTRMDRMNRDVH